MTQTQTDRLVAYLREHPGATPMQLVTELRIPKYTSRISDARKEDHVIEAVKREGVTHYYLREPDPEQLAWTA